MPLLPRPSRPRLLRPYTPPRSHMSRPGPFYPRTPRPHSLDHGATGTLTPCEALNMGLAWWLQEGSTSDTNSCPTWRVRACVLRNWATAAGSPLLGCRRPASRRYPRTAATWAAAAGQSPRYLQCRRWAVAAATDVRSVRGGVPQVRLDRRGRHRHAASVARFTPRMCGACAGENSMRSRGLPRLIS